MTYDKRHGGPYDRGSADAYYNRAFDPHYYIMEKSMFSERVEELAEDELAAYTAGYNEQVDSGVFKEWR